MTTAPHHLQPKRLRLPSWRRLAATAPATFRIGRKDWLQSLLVFVCAAVVLILADVAALSLHTGDYQIDVGNYRDSYLLSGTHSIETAPNGQTTYRWTEENAELWLPHLDIAPHALLTMHLGPRAAAGMLDLGIDGAPWASLPLANESRTYTLLLPPNLPDKLLINLHSTPFFAPGDARPLGVPIESFDVSVLGSAFAPLSYVGVQLLCLLAVVLMTLRLGWHWRWQAVAAVAVAVALAVVLAAILLLAYIYTARLAIAGLVLAALTWFVLPIIERRCPWLGDVRQIRMLWSLLLVACLLRMTGVLYPTFSGQDLGRNVRRLLLTMNGQMVIIAGSSEFADGQTIYPPGPYLVAMPLMLLTNAWGPMLQGALALLDGFSVLLVAMVVRRLGGNHLAACLAAVLYTANLAAFAGMTFSFSAQIFGQWLTAPMVLLLLAPGALARVRTWWWVVFLLTIGVLSHIGVAILGVTWVGFVLLFYLIFARRFSRSFWWGVGLLAGSLVLAVGLLYIHILEVSFSHAGGVVSDAAQSSEQSLFPGATALLWKGMWLVYTGAGLLVLPLGLWMILRLQPPLERLVVTAAWVATVLLYLGVDLLLELQVRYFYFALPLALATIAIALSRIAQHGGRFGKVAVWALVLGAMFYNAALWYGNTWGSYQITMTTLTH